MGARLRNEWSWWAAALAGVAVMSWLTLQGFAWSDYDHEVSAAAKSLIAGDVHGFLAQVPAYGGSLVLRAPIAGRGRRARRRRARGLPRDVGSRAARGAVLGIVLVRRLAGRGCSTGVRALVLGLCVANPLTIRALEIGHPEELLCAAFAIGAVLAAVDGRTLLAAVLLGLAIATKSWAVLAIGPGAARAARPARACARRSPEASRWRCSHRSCSPARIAP